ncbi:DUF255 domain-containing protein [Pedobacter panaciterrae]
MELKTRSSLFLATALLVFSNLGTRAQERKGIKFEHGLSWEQVKTKAKAENKYIFMDVFATWCGPCKAMDEKVYPNERLGNFVNDEFISIKVQADTSKLDNDETKSWYADAKRILVDNKVNGLPTFLFFSSTGKLVDRGIGYKDINGLLELAGNAINPKKQYYTQVEKYRRKKLDFNDMPSLAKTAKSFNQNELANIVAEDYIDHYLLKLREDKLFTKDNLTFISDFMGNTKTNRFKFFFKNQEKVDGILGENKSAYSIRTAINQDYIPDYKTWTSSPPDWDSVEKTVTKTFGHLGQEMVWGKRMIYAQDNKQWEALGKYYQLYFEKVLRRPEYDINHVSWDVFLHVKDPKVLEFTIEVMRYALDVYYTYNPGAVDTYANLLHKVGRTREAIEWEEKAAQPFVGTEAGKPFAEALERMKNGLPTWETN